MLSQYSWVVLSLLSGVSFASHNCTSCWCGSRCLCMWGQKKRSRTRWSVRSTLKCSISSCSWFNISEWNFGDITSWVRVDVWRWRTPSASHNSLAFSRANNKQLTVDVSDPWPFLLDDTLFHRLQQWILLLCSSQLFRGDLLDCVILWLTAHLRNCCRDGQWTQEWHSLPLVDGHPFGETGQHFRLYLLGTGEHVLLYVQGHPG